MEKLNNQRINNFDLIWNIDHRVSAGIEGSDWWIYLNDTLDGICLSFQELQEKQNVFEETVDLLKRLT